MIFILKNLNILFDFIMRIPWSIKYRIYKKTYDIHPSVGFNGPGTLIAGEGILEIGEKTYMGRYCSIQIYPEQKVIIGSNCSISHFVKIYTQNNSAMDIIKNKYPNSYSVGNVTIGNNCWIGANVFIKEGVSIGNHCVIGANSVVTKNIPDCSIAVGAPARIIKNVTK